MECTHCDGTGRFVEDVKCLPCGGTGRLDDLVARFEGLSDRVRAPARPWLGEPVGADRRCAGCGACIAKGFEVFGPRREIYHRGCAIPKLVEQLP